MAEDVLDGRFELQALLGSGGMAAVYRAWDREGRRPCAVKVLADVLAGDPEVRRRFRNEAAAAGALRHPRIVTIYGWGQDGLRQFIAMEYVGGGTVRERLQRDGRLSEVEALRVAAEVADALAYAHARHVVHRDIKPHNILLTDDGHVKVADFGIALTLDGTSLTRTGTVMGSAPYVSPEQVRGETAGPASDLYALGIVLYEMLAGHAPFAGEAPVAVAYKHLHERPRSLREAGVDVSPATAALVERLLAKSPQKRYPNTAALAAELHRLAGERASRLSARGVQREPRRRGAERAHDATARLTLPPETIHRAGRQGASASPAEGSVRRDRAAAAVDTTVRLDPSPSTVDATAVLGEGAAAADTAGSHNGPGAGSRAVHPDDTYQLPAAAAPVMRGHTASFAAMPAARAHDAHSGTSRLRLPGSRDRTVVAARATIAAVCVFFGLAFLVAAYRAAWTAAHVTTPNLVGRTVADAGRTVETLNLGVLVSGKRQDPKASFGVVLAQNPAPGVNVAKGTVINLTVSQGSGMVPDLGGQTVQAASGMLERVGLRLGRVNYAVAIQMDPGRIIYQFQPAGTHLQPNGGVDVIVSQGFRIPFLFPAPHPDRGPGPGGDHGGPGPRLPKAPGLHEHRG
jgi:eukaryotic-like serine/threonine-protein kinase